MALRVTQSMIYGNSISGMNRALSDYMESNLQSSTQKRINRPSDDPTGASQVIASRNRLNTLVRYQSNINRATGWLNSIDYALAGNPDGSVQAVLTAIKGLDLQGSTGTVTDENRLQIAASLREFYDQLISLANQDFDGNYLFGGQKVNTPPYAKALGVDAVEPAMPRRLLDGAGIPVVGGTATGSYSKDLIVEVVSITGPNHAYRYSEDGGATWVDALAPAGAPMTIPGGSVEIAPPAQGVFTVPANTVKGNEFHAEGWSDTTVIIQPVPPADGSAGPGDQVAAKDATYRYSEDGGKTWKDCVVVPDLPHNLDNVADPAGTAQVKIQAGGVSVTISDQESPVTIVDPANAHSNDNGTWLYVRPTAVYQGDDHDTQVVASYDALGVNAKADGNFTRDVAVRVDDVSGGLITYSYSLDDGNNWVQSKAPAVPSGVPVPSYNLPVPGGYLNMDSLPSAGNQFTIQPHRADIDLQISTSSSITINMVGKEIFGGLYNYPGDGIKNPVPVTGQPNIFESVGKLIAAAETNNQQGFQEAMEELTEGMNLVLTKSAIAGGREDRLIASAAQITGSRYSEEERLSAVEDIDLMELMTRLKQQEMAYNSVMRSSSMIMQMSLVNFL